LQGLDALSSAVVELNKSAAPRTVARLTPAAAHSTRRSHKKLLSYLAPSVFHHWHDAEASTRC
ncbi:hypothetical protein PMAYCL1PPCAC_20983, partial [Pristionchus mayeri]